MANGRLRIGYPVAGTYSLSAEAGTYSLSGQSATLVRTTLDTTPTYAPFFKNALSAGTPGSLPSAFTFVGGSKPGGYVDTTISTAVAGPFGESQVTRVAIDQDYTFFGGELASSGVALSAGDDLWGRVFYYFPTAFKAGNHNGFGASDGAAGVGLKWIRMQYASGRNTYKVGGIAPNGTTAAASSPTVMGLAPELSTTTNHYLSSEVVIPRDQWVALQFRIRHGSTAGGNLTDFWIGSTYIGTASAMATPQYGGNLTSILIGDYWNGSGPVGGTAFYISNAVFTKQTPNTLDSGGRPYISPSTRITDFA